MKLQRAHLLAIALCMALTPVSAELDKRQRSRASKETGSVRMKMMGQIPKPKTESQVTTRGGNVTIYVAPPPTGQRNCCTSAATTPT